MRTLASLALLLGCILPALAQDSVPVIPLKPDPPIAVDGSLQDWAGVPNALTVTGKEHATYNATTWTGPADLGATMHLAWRNEGLYLGLEITDDVVVQTQRDEKLYQGDHVEVFLDFAPDLEPERNSFGKGQFQFAFSPGNFKHTGDPLVDIGPEMYCYQPKGGPCTGTKYAAVKTAQGWTAEIMLPFALLGVSPAPNLPLGLEIALSDCDSREPAQETFYTISTKPWHYGRGNLGLFVLGDVAGKGTPPPQSFPVAEAVTVPFAKTVEVPLPKVEVPKGKDAYLFFRSRIDFKTVAGYSNALQTSVNGTNLGADRLTNRPVKSTRNNGAVDNVVTPDGLLYTPYGPDFTAVNDHTAYGMQGGVKPCEWEFRITDLLKAEGNVLQLRNCLRAPVERDVVLGAVEIRIKTPPPPPAPKRPAPTGPLPVIVPHATLKTAYTARETGPGKIEVKMGGESYLIQSLFSSPDGQWQSASCPSFRYQRRLTVKDEWVLVQDTFTNLTGENLPLIQRHTCDLKDRAKKFWCSGISPASGEIVMSDPQNPTSFAVTDKTGLGLMAWNDEFQVHVTNSAVGGVLGLADQSLVLAPGKTYTAEWFILPVAQPDFWDFVNVARRARGTNFTLPWMFAFLGHGSRTDGWSDDKFATFIRNKSANIVAASIDYPRYNGHYTHGTPFQKIDLSSYAAYSARVRRLCPGVKTQVYFHCFLDVLDDADKLYADARVLLANGQQANYGQPYDKIFFPTLTNTFGRDIARNVDLIFDTCKADGVYWDEMDYSAYKYHYGQPWDGCSGDIDPQTGKLIGLKSSVALLSQPFRQQLAEKIMARGPLVCNGAPHTRTMTNLHYQGFVETAAISNCLRAVLYSPVALGDHISERKEVDAYRWMLGALDYGCLYSWYSDTVYPEYETLTKYMFPTTPLELHEGYLIGRERIVTKVSGVYGWGDKSAHEVHVFDAEGREVKDFKAPTVVRDGKTYTELRLAEDWSAAIVRH